MRISRRSGLLLLAAAAAARPARAQELKPIRVVGPPIDGFKAVYYGIQAGLFRKEGLDVSVTAVSGGAAAAAATIGGAAEIAYTNSLSLFQAHQRGIPMRFIAASVLLTDTSAPTQTVCLKSAPFKSGRDLNGKTLGSTSIKDVNAAVTLAWVDAEGGDSKSVHLIEVPSSAAAAFLEDGRADAVTLNEPAVSAALATGKVRVLARPFEAIAKRVQGAGYAVMQPVVDRDPDAMARFARAMHAAQNYTNAHFAETVSLVSGYAGVAPEIVAKSVRVVDPEYVDPRNLQPLIDALAKYGFLERAFPAQEVISSAALRIPQRG